MFDDIFSAINSITLSGISNFSVERANTGLHDIEVKFNGFIFLVEVKTDEPFWYNKTGNIGLDYYSSFNYLKNSSKFDFWIMPNELDDFKNSIIVNKEGKLFTCDASIQVYYVENKLLIGYSNKKLQNDSFIKYLECNYRLRVNNKKAYGIKDTWQSAAYFVNPLTDKELIQCEIRDINDLIEAIST